MTSAPRRHCGECGRELGRRWQRYLLCPECVAKVGTAEPFRPRRQLDDQELELGPAPAPAAEPGEDGIPF